MRTFYFNIKYGPFNIPDRFGTRLPSVEAALSKARDSAVFIAADKAIEQRVVRSTRIEVADDAGRVIAFLPFAFAR